MKPAYPAKSYINSDWEPVLKQAGYPDFDTWWNAEGELVEEGNFRGKDDSKYWSNVHRITLNDGKVVYLKRQQNHFPTNTLLKFLKIPTFTIEWKNFLRMRKAGVPTMNIILYASRRHEGNRQSLIVSEELKGMKAMAKLVNWYDANGWPPREQRRAILTAILKVLKKTHDQGIIHNALYGRHIYLNITFIDGKPMIPKDINVCFIDLERAKYPGRNSPKMIRRDLRSMYFDIPQWPNSDKMWFFRKYLGIDRLTDGAKDEAKFLINSKRRK